MSATYEMDDWGGMAADLPDLVVKLRASGYGSLQELLDSMKPYKEPGAWRLDQMRAGKQLSENLQPEAYADLWSYCQMRKLMAQHVQNQATAKGMSAAQLKKWLLKRVDKRHRKAVKMLHDKNIGGAEFLELAFEDLVNTHKMARAAALQIAEVRDRFAGATYVWTLLVWPDATPVGPLAIRVKGPFGNVADFIVALKQAKPNELASVPPTQLRAYASEVMIKRAIPMHITGNVPLGSSPEVPVLVVKPWDDKKKEAAPKTEPKKKATSIPVPTPDMAWRVFTSLLANALRKGTLEQADAEEAARLGPNEAVNAASLYEQDNTKPFAEKIRELLAAKREQKRREQMSKMSRKQLRDTMRRHMTKQRYTMAESLFEVQSMDGQTFTKLVWDHIKFTDGIGPDNARFLLDWRQQYYEGKFESTVTQQDAEQQKLDPNLCSATVENLLERGLPYEDVCGDCGLSVADHGVDAKFQERMSGILKKARAELTARDMWRLGHRPDSAIVWKSDVPQSYKQHASLAKAPGVSEPVQPEPAPEQCKCGKPSTKFCSACKLVWYCSRECQTTDWKQHRLVCAALVMQRNHPSLKHLMPILNFIAANGITKPERITACSRMLATGNDVLRCVQSHPWLAQPKTLAMYQAGVKYFNENSLPNIADKFDQVARDLAAATKFLSTSTPGAGGN